MDGERETSKSEADDRQLTRREFLVGSPAVGAAATLSGGAFVTETGDVSIDPWVRGSSERTVITAPQTSSERHWLGPELWGNRLQDWQAKEGRVECLRGDAGFELRSVAVLTRELLSGTEPGHLRVWTGIAEDADGDGFGGLLLGIGNGELDYRAAALAQRSSGTGGGTLCTFETDGRVRFREHTDEENSVAYEELPADDRTEPDSSDRWTADADVALSVDILPQSDGRFAVHLKAFAAGGVSLLSEAVRRDVPESELLGGIAFVSSTMPGEDGPCWWFDRLETSGAKIATRPERTFGPVAGTLYSVHDSVLKLTAQLLPVGEADPETVRLRYRPADGAGSWRTERATLGPGYTALFRVEGWNSTRAWEYRVVYRDETRRQWSYEGRIDAEPTDTDELTIGLLSCTTASSRSLDGTESPTDHSQTAVPGRYTPENIYVPYATLTRNLRSHDPDLLVSVGDQLYENRPTGVEDPDDPGLDYLYKWYLWHWSFQDLTRETPTIVLVDDHDVYQPKIWGSGGDRGEMGELYEGGYVGDADFVNRVQRTQCGHNPDPYDPTPTERGIRTYYGAFTYGGTRFAMLEDRKFKTGPNERNDVPNDEIELLGDRQERFLAEWAKEGSDSAANVCLTQTCFAAPFTTENGSPAKRQEIPSLTYETNAYPTPHRDRAIELLRDAGALVLGGDLHLPLLVRHGLDGYTDAVVQFNGPAGAATYARWFDPTDSLPNDRGYPNTGEFTDAFGNDLRVLAVDNPAISFERAQRPDGGPAIFDRALRADGYGIVRVNYADEAFVVECWPWFADPTDDAAQFTGWPYRLPFDRTASR